ncbi:hypothetical protein K488DRAFT_77143 [Vararia minispora EC-137]|uniref:Uncharacterized protein n=1 Tax=Vararia minispora EC-137 TaxID=1314806 RepID=A0ACB8QT94_9AGAM|nr:hypothetical protein K488DRAFT_77143 [Vararia minispora EC-137]
MSLHEPGSKSAPVQITEDEAALYDRQIRLWGLEAQQKMRNATIVIFTLRGTATEAIKNIVLAGIGRLVVVDDALVSPEDLGAGFFFRDEDVGRKRADAAKPRIESLNPLVTVDVVPELPRTDPELDALLERVDLVCLTDGDRDTCLRINAACRRRHVPLYCGGTFGLLGYAFCDLLSHDYITPDRAAASKDGAPRNVKSSTTYVPLEKALQHSWASLTRRQTKELNPAVVFTVLAIWEFEHLQQGSLPSNPLDAEELARIMRDLVEHAGVNKQWLAEIPRELLECAATTASHELSPVCAVVGGFLAQDILKTLSAREAPLANFFTFDGNTGAATVARLGMP